MQVTRTAARAGLGAILGIAGIAFAPGPVRAESDCIHAYEATQVARRGGHPVEARAQALACAQPACPRLMASECAQWAAELERAASSVILSFQRPDGSDAIGARVTVDGHPTPLDGHPVPLDPGPHTVRVELDGFEPIEQRILAQEGEQRRRIEGRLSPAKPPPLPPVDRTPALWAVGVAAVTLSLGIGFGSAALVEYDKLSASCAPGCSPGDTTQVRARAVVADVSFGLSAVSLAVAAGLFFRPAPRVRVALVPAQGGGGLLVEGRLP
jgi:hypothetical protein